MAGPLPQTHPRTDGAGATPQVIEGLYGVVLIHVELPLVAILDRWSGCGITHIRDLNGCYLAAAGRLKVSC